MSSQKYTKTLASGTDGMYVCDARYAFQRQTNLPAGWKRVRIAAIFSPCGLASENDNPIAEVLTSDGTTGFDTEFVFGLSNGTLAPGKTGNKFVGLGRGSTTTTPAVGLNTGTSTWRYNASTAGSANISLASVRGNGTTIGRTSGLTRNWEFGVPSATTLFAFGIGLDLDCTTNGSLLVSATESVKMSTATEPDLMALLAGTLTAYGTALTGGWWDSSTPVDCTYFYIRWPFLSSRLRLHACAYMQLA